MSPQAMMELPEVVVRTLDAPITSLGHGCGFPYAGLRIVVAADRVEAVQELSAYIPIALCEIPADGVVDEVVFVHDHHAATQLHDRITASEALEVAVKPDFSYRRLRVGDIDLFASHLGYDDLCHVVLKRRERVVMLSATLHEHALRSPLRIVREIILRRLENRGGVFAHCAIARGPGTANAIIVGEGGAGKTSVCWELIRHGDGCMVANDRAVLMSGPEGLRGYGWPIAMRLGMGTVHATLDVEAIRGLALRRGQVDAIWEQDFQTAASNRANFKNPDKLELTPQEVVTLTGSAVVDMLRVEMALYPQLELGGGPLKITPVTDATATATLRANVSGPVDGDYLQGWLGLREVSAAQLSRAAQHTIDRIRALPGFRVSGDPSSLPELHERLAGVWQAAGNHRPAAGSDPRR